MVNSLIVTARHHKTAVRPRPMKRSKRRDECAERGLFKKLGDPRSVLSWGLSPSPNLLACIRGQGVSRPASFRPVLPWLGSEGQQRVRLSFRSNNRICPSRPLQPIRKDLVIRFRRRRLAREAIMAAKEISVKKYVVRLSGEERERLETLLRKGKSPARRGLKARILLKADVSEAGKGWSDNRIIEALETSPSMVYRVRKQLVEEGFEAVLSRKPRAMPAVARIFDGEKEAKLIALACSKPPKGRARWTLRLLENKVVELGIVDRASDSTIGRALKKTLFSPIAASTGSSRRRPTARS